MTTNKIEGKTVVITAGNRGGGSAIALRYAAAGANVAIISDKLVLPTFVWVRWLKVASYGIKLLYQMKSSLCKMSPCLPNFSV